MRVGSNPLRDLFADDFPLEIAAIITHLPTLTGYHEHRFDVVKVCLGTARRFSGLPMFIWDNGSCPEFRQWLVQTFQPEFLHFSPNYGKSTARASVFKMLPPGTTVAMSDDDILFYPEWFSKQQDLLLSFPSVGVVSGYPVRTQFRWATSWTHAWAEKNGKAELVRFIPDEWEKDFAISVGREWEYHKTYTAHDRDLLIEYNGIKALGTAHHCQFIGYQERVAPFCEASRLYLDDERQFDMAINAARLLRLTTIDRVARHIGNVIDDKIALEINNLLKGDYHDL